MMAALLIFLSGLIFAIGLGIAGMTQPQKVTGFLNVMGDWDPSLMMVMAGGATTYFLLRLLIFKRPAPLFERMFSLPTRKDIDASLIGGAALFGLGWGMVGFCPGPALVSASTGHPAVLLFVLAMATGMFAFDRFATRSRPGLEDEVGVVQKG